MSVALTNRGQFGWVTNRSGYRYHPIDPAIGKRWPAMPHPFAGLAIEAAKAAGFAGFWPDACLEPLPAGRAAVIASRSERT
jgi:alkylated DNA repair protein (DNA oxidative demethylase)